MTLTLIYGYFFYYISALIGISMGYHRYFTHGSFKTNSLFECVMLIFGLICGGRSALTWAAVHRMHHANADTEEDPHSPIYVGIWRVITSRWYVNRIPKKYVVPLLKNPRVVFFHRYGKYIHMSYAAIVLMFGINAFVIFVIMPYVLAWVNFGLLNWIAHKDGVPADVPFMNLLAPGEGWHKYHHDHPRAYKLNKYDIAGWLIERIFIKSKFSN